MSITQIFAFEVIPSLVEQKCGIHMVNPELPPPRILKWKLTKRPRGTKLDAIFTATVSIVVVNVYNF